jgi:hypothetical protein
MSPRSAVKLPNYSIARHPNCGSPGKDDRLCRRIAVRRNRQAQEQRGDRRASKELPHLASPP